MDSEFLVGDSATDTKVAITIEAGMSDVVDGKVEVPAAGGVQGGGAVAVLEKGVPSLDFVIVVGDARPAGIADIANKGIFDAGVAGDV